MSRLNTICLVVIATMTSSAMSAAPLSFSRDIKPILSDSCYHCHGPDDMARESELRFDLRASVFELKVLTNGAMLEHLTSNDPDVRMPPPDSKRILRTEDRQTLILWIEQGAPWPTDDRHWAFVPPQRPAVPTSKKNDQAANAIDQFIHARLEQENLTPAKRADKATLLRRVTFDLIGLPPNKEDLERFITDPSPVAYEQAVDRLLNDPRYGEHMALDWLEASRYADTDGYQNDRLRYMWVWRDWLIQAINTNMPFDQFVTEQMAGDLLPNRDFYTQVATGFNRNHRINSEGGSIPDEWIVEYVADRVETMGTMFLGLTLNCSRCHNHKYDPIEQREFYELFAFFNNIAEAGLGPNNGNSPPFIAVPETWPHLTTAQEQFIVPAPVKIQVVQTSVPRPQSGNPKTVMVLHELEKPRDTYLLNRGQYDQPEKSEKLTPAIPQAIGGWDPQWPRNRLGLAKWLTSDDHPLTARVTINRIWQHFFGTGIVKTSENFGVQGEYPSHPQLLDYLATEFIANDWNVKAMHRLIVTSDTYRQSSAASAELEQRDPENKLLARGPRKRLSPYAIRDAALFNSGLLVEDVGGPSVKPYMPPQIWRSISNAAYQQDQGAKIYRRSMYTYWRRTVPPPTMMAFNASSRETCIVRNDQTNTPLQALTMMNNITFVETARLLAQRELANTPVTAATRVVSGFQRITSRKPTGDEFTVLMNDYDAYIADFEADPDSAKKLLSIGASPYNQDYDISELAALTLIMNTILNLDEAITQN
jgi:hypothetical protein